jgi:hypothetical protein
MSAEAVVETKGVDIVAIAACCRHELISKIDRGGSYI